MRMDSLPTSYTHTHSLTTIFHFVHHPLPPLPCCLTYALGGVIGGILLGAVVGAAVTVIGAMTCLWQVILLQLAVLLYSTLFYFNIPLLMLSTGSAPPMQFVLAVINFDYTHKICVLPFPIISCNCFFLLVMPEQLSGAMTRKLKLKLIHPLLHSLNRILENVECAYSSTQVTLGLIRTPQAVVAATTGERRRGEK